MKEKIVEIGEGYKLNAIVSLPETVEEKKPALIILNSGVMHRVGTCRTSVSLARKAAENGTLALRFDLSGIGDSSARATGDTDDDRVKAEVFAAMDFVQKNYGIKQFLLYGLCSGAHNSYKAALVDDRIVGLAGIDGFAYKTKKFYFNKIAARIFRLSFWINTVKRILASGKSAGNQAESEADYEIGEMWPSYPPREETEKGYAKLIDRGVKLLIIYTGGQADEYNYQDQFYDMYPSVEFGNSLELKLIPEASHIMAEPLCQQQIFSTIQNWIKANSAA